MLDEPTNGLDPNQIVDIRNLIRDIAEHHAVLLSTHILSEIQAICDNVKMIDNGKLVFSGTMEEFDNYITPTSFTVEFENSPTIEVLSSVSESISVESIGENRFRVFISEDIGITEIFIKQSVENNWDLKELVVERSTLDEVFAQLSGKTIVNNNKSINDVK